MDLQADTLKSINNYFC